MNHNVDPAFWFDAFSLKGETPFFYLFGKNLIFFFKRVLIFVLFLKGKQNKKENSKCNSLFGKNGV